MSAVLSQPVLVINKNYRAVNFASVKRAFCLLANGVAEVIDVEDGKYYNYDFESWQELSEFESEFEDNRYDWVNCVDYKIPIPKIVRLLAFGEFKRPKVKFNRRNIYARDKNTCQYCGKRFSTKDLNLDHVLPRSLGGQSCWTNIVCSCIKCNTKKANRTPEQAGMKLIRPPKALDRPIFMVKEKYHHDSWKHFVDEAYWNVTLRD